MVDKQTEMLVIGAGLDRTGTTSLREALHRLGLKTYTMTLAAFKDTELWYQHALKRQDGDAGIYPQLVDLMAQEGYNATVGIPNCFYYKELMARYPKAKVILTVRPNGAGESYAKSILNSVARTAPMLERVPFKWFLFKSRRVMEWVKAEQGCPHDPITRLPTNQCLADSYDSWVKQVRETVPSSQLLVFKPTDGWQPLCDFLSPLDPTIATNCQDISNSQEAYPFVNDAATVRSALNVLHWVALLFENGPTLFVLGYVAWWTSAKMKRSIKK